jgi:hypothetical protein
MATEQNHEELHPEGSEPDSFDSNPNINLLFTELRKVLRHHYFENRLSVASVVGCLELLKIELVDQSGFITHSQEEEEA